MLQKYYTKIQYFIMPSEIENEKTPIPRYLHIIIII